MQADFDLTSYDYHLPAGNIAQVPAPDRDGSRLMVLDCRRDGLAHGRFPDLPGYMEPGDLVVVNDTRVFPARLAGRKESGGKVELMLLAFPAVTAGDAGDGAGWREVEATALLKSSKRPRPGTRLLFNDHLQATVTALHEYGKVTVRLRYQGDLEELLAAHGRIPLPPYIHREAGEQAEDRERYQTLFARHTGAVAAPTAGLHFSDKLLLELRQAGINLASVTLHVGYGTFAPVREKDIRRHRIHQEYVIVSEETARLVNETRAAGRRVWTVGTTTARTLEFMADDQGRLRAGEGWCDLFIYPGYRFRVVNTLITNFHLPGSSLLFLVAALTGRQRILRCYEEAVRLDYRFFSYGDAMAIIT